MQVTRQEIMEIAGALYDMVSFCERHGYRELKQEITKQICEVLKNVVDDSQLFHLQFGNVDKHVPKPSKHELELARSSKLDAVREYKNRTGMSLMESKYTIEAFL